jgi:hypothetical protein
MWLYLCTKVYRWLKQPGHFTLKTAIREITVRQVAVQTGSRHLVIRCISHGNDSLWHMLLCTFFVLDTRWRIGKCQATCYRSLMPWTPFGPFFNQHVAPAPYAHPDVCSVFWYMLRLTASPWHSYSTHVAVVGAFYLALLVCPIQTSRKGAEHNTLRSRSLSRQYTERGNRPAW